MTRHTIRAVIMWAVIGFTVLFCATAFEMPATRRDATSVRQRCERHGWRCCSQIRQTIEPIGVMKERNQGIASFVRGGNRQLLASSTNSRSGDEAKAKDVLSYYLVWSPGMLVRTVLSTLILALLRMSVGSFHDRTMTLWSLSSKVDLSTASSVAPLQSIMQNLLLPLLGSACCAIQLIINMVVGAGGCAGFNKRLGPLRPYFLSVLFYATMTSFSVSNRGAWARGAFLRWTVALLPEIVHLWNVGLGRRLQSRTAISKTAAGDTIEATIELIVPTMGCVACVNKIDSSLRHCAPDQVDEAKSWLEEKGGRAHVRAHVASPEEAQKLARTLVTAVQGAGFDTCTLDSVRTESP